MYRTVRDRSNRGRDPAHGRMVLGSLQGVHQSPTTESDVLFEEDVCLTCPEEDPSGVQWPTAEWLRQENDLKTHGEAADGASEGVWVLGLRRIGEARPLAERRARRGAQT